MMGRRGAGPALGRRRRPHDGSRATCAPWLTSRFSPEAEAFRAEVVAWLGRLDADTWPPTPTRRDLTGLDEAFERSLHAEAGERGWLDLPVELQAVFNFEAARADAPVVDTAMTLTGTAVGRFATNDHHRQVLADMAAGRVEGCAAYTEPDAGTDLGRLRGTATRDGDGWVLDGHQDAAHRRPQGRLVRDGPAHRRRPGRTGPLGAVDVPGRPAPARGDRPSPADVERLDARRDRVRRRPGRARGPARHRGRGLAPDGRGAGGRALGDVLAGLRPPRARPPRPPRVHHRAATARLLADDPLVLDEIGRLETAWASADLLSRRALWSQSTDTDVAAPRPWPRSSPPSSCTTSPRPPPRSPGPTAWCGRRCSPAPTCRGAAAGGRFAWEYLERVHATIGAGVNEVHRDAIAATLLGRPGR